MDQWKSRCMGKVCDSLVPKIGGKFQGLSSPVNVWRFWTYRWCGFTSLSTQRSRETERPVLNVLYFSFVSCAIYYTYSFRNSNLHMDFETMAWFSWEDSLCYFRRGCMMFTLYWQVLPESVESFCNVFLCHSTTICCLDSVLSLISVMMYSLSCWWWKMDHWCFTWVVESNPWWFVLVVSIHVNVEKQGEEVKK